MIAAVWVSLFNLPIILKVLVIQPIRAVETVYKAHTETDVYESSAVPKSTTSVNHATETLAV